MRPTLPLALVLAAMLSPAPALADTFTGWVAGDAKVLGGTGDTFAAFDGPLGGVQAGLELFGVDTWGEALFAEGGQYYLSMNLGFDHAWGRKTRFVLGVFTGPVYFHTAQSAVPVVDTTTLTPAQRAIIEANVPGGVDRVTTEVESYADQEAQLRESALGWNVARMRVDLEQRVVPMLYVGVGGQVGYHLILTGDDAAAEARRQALDDLATRYGIAQADRDTLAEAFGARELTADSLDGFGWSVGAYVKFEL
jgi:hypothetical protein